MTNEKKVIQIYNTTYKQCIEDGYHKKIAATCAIMCRTGAEIMAEWKDEQFEAKKKALIDKACEWLKKRLTFEHPRTGEKSCVLNLSYFRQAMEE